MSLVLRKTLKQLTEMVDAWNEKHPVGTRVSVRLDGGDTVQTETVSEAWMLGGNTPVIKLAGIRGGYALERVAPLAA